MAAKPTIITCLNCGTKNRVRPRAEGIPRCSVCHTLDEEIVASIPVLVDFWAPWCGPCRMVSPVVEQIGREYAGRLKVVKLNIDEAPEIATRYAIQGIPQLVVIKDGQEADRLVGAVPPAQLRAMIDRHVTAVAEPPGVSS